MPSSALNNKIVLVTGGAQGLGAAIVETLSSSMTVVIGDIKEIQNNQYFMKLNVTDENSVNAVIDLIIKQYGRLDVLINNAGTDVTKPITEMSPAEWDRVISVNLRGPFLLSKAALEQMSKQHSGHIINITSTAAKRAWPNASAYHASKWGLLGFSHALFTEAREFNVKVTAVVAGGMKTPFILDRFPDVNQETLQSPQAVASVIKDIINLPLETVIPEVMVLPLKETSWP